MTEKLKKRLAVLHGCNTDNPNNRRILLANTSTSASTSKSSSPILYSKLVVLPFENNSGDSSFIYLSDGIPENLINQLSRSINLRVLSRNSTFLLDELETNPSRIKKQFDADLILTGRVSKNKYELAQSDANKARELLGEWDLNFRKRH